MHRQPSPPNTDDRPCSPPENGLSDRRLQRTQKSLASQELLIIDELGTGL
jgi:hypothetical protein